MKRVLLVATTTGYQIRSFGQAAAKLGVRLVFASDRCDQLEDPWWDQAIPVRFHEDALSVAAVVAAFGERAPDGIVAVGDRPAVLAARLTQAFGLPGHPPAAATISRNKLATRMAFRAAGLATPWFQHVPLDVDVSTLTAVPYPAVIKPVALSGSRGVMRVNTAAELADAFARLRRLLHAVDVRLEQDAAHDRALIESFVPGAEFAIEGLLHQGDLRVLAIFEKPDPMDGPFFEETMYVTPPRISPAVQRQMTETIAAAARALGLYHGPIHAECRVEVPAAGRHRQPDVFVLEVAARPIGGLCSKALRFDRGQGAGGRGQVEPADVSLEEVLLRHAIGEDVSGVRRESLAAGVMMIPIPRKGVFKGVDGVDAAAAIEGIESVEITAKPDTVLIPLPEGRSYLGFIFARALDPSQVIEALQQAHARLRFAIEREVVVL